MSQANTDEGMTPVAQSGFRLVSEGYWEDVTIIIKDNRKQYPIKMRICFRYIDDATQTKTLQKLQGEGADAAVCEQVVAEFKPFADLDGNQVPYSQETRDLVFNQPVYTRAIVRHYFDSLDSSKTKRGN